MKKTNFNPNKLLFQAKKYKISKFFKNEWIYFLAVCSNFFKEKGFLKYFAFGYFIYFIGYFGLIRANIYYVDDIYRSYSGNFAFLSASRYTSEYLSKLIHLNLYRNTDISPVTHLIAIALISIGSMILVKIIFKKQNFWALLASVALGLNPFFLQNMSYKFDSPFMALALISPIIPFLFLRKKFIFYLLSFIFILISLTTYQAANGIYIIMSMFIILTILTQKQVKTKNILSYIFLFLSSYLFSLIFYKIFIFNPTENNIKHSLIGNKIALNIYNNIKFTFKNYCEIIDKTILEYLLIIIFSIFILSILQNSKKNKFNSLIFTLIFLFSIITMSQGIYLLLKNFYVGPRVFVCIGVILSIISIYSLKNKIKILNLILKPTIIMTVYFLIIQANAYANALKTQEIYAKYRINIMISDLNKILPIEKNYKIFINSGQIGNAPMVKNLERNYPIIKKANWFKLYKGWTHQTILYNYGLNVSWNLCSNEKNKINKIINTNMHKIIKYDNNCFTIEFK